jgi:hypothetical protein
MQSTDCAPAVGVHVTVIVFGVVIDTWNDIIDGSGLIVSPVQVPLVDRPSTVVFDVTVDVTWNVVVFVSPTVVCATEPVGLLTSARAATDATPTNSNASSPTRFDI